MTDSEIDQKYVKLTTKAINREMKFFKILLLIVVLLLGIYAFHKYNQARTETRTTDTITNDNGPPARDTSDVKATLNLRDAQRMTGGQVSGVTTPTIVVQQGREVAVADMESPEGVLLAAQARYGALNGLKFNNSYY